MVTATFPTASHCGKNATVQGFLAPDQLFSAGYRDGLAGKAPSLTHRRNPDYSRGHQVGYRECPTSLFNVAATPQDHLERGWGDELLNVV